MSARNRFAQAKRPSAQAFIDEAELQLARSRRAISSDEAVIYAYRAALRAAGSLIESGMAHRKRRPGGSAWAKLKVARPDLVGIAEDFEREARLVSRASLGLERELPQSTVDRLHARATELIELARGEIQYFVRVA